MVSLSSLYPSLVQIWMSAMVTTGVSTVVRTWWEATAAVVLRVICSTISGTSA